MTPELSVAILCLVLLPRQAAAVVGVVAHTDQLLVVLAAAVTILVEQLARQVKDLPVALVGLAQHISVAVAVALGKLAETIPQTPDEMVTADMAFNRQSLVRLPIALAVVVQASILATILV
jgi:hypothetical protein